MDFDDKTINEIADQLGIPRGKGQAATKVKEFENKSDKEVLDEIIKLTGKLNAKGISKAKQLELAEALMPMMNNEQRARLKKLIKLLGR